MGRDAELEHLRSAQQLASSRYGQVVAIVGEPGVGKSRLLYEFSSPTPQGWRVLEGDALSYGKATSYLALVDLLRDSSRSGIAPTCREIRAKVTERVLARDRALEPALPALLALFDVPATEGRGSR